MKKFILITILLPFAIFAQVQKNISQSEKTDAKKNLKRDFRSINLLENFETVLEKLQKDTVVILDSESDFDLLDKENPSLIKAKIPQYLDHAYYQFYKSKLFSISLFFNTERYDYLSIYKKLKLKYGKPTVFNSLNCIWEDEKTLIILDNLPSLKYIDKESFKQINNGKEFLEKDEVKENILEDL